MRILLILLATLAPAAELTVRPISSRADTVSGNDALIEIRSTAPFKATLNGRDITAVFKSAGIGLVTGLRTGRNTLEVRAVEERAQLTLVNHPISGPIFSGPHQAPFVCETEAAGLGPAAGTDCSAPPKVEYYYRTKSGEFKPYDTSAPRPADIVRTRTVDGKEIDYFVRRERGVINRAVYDIAIVHVPGGPEPDPWRRTAGWNGRLVYTFGGACRAGYHQGKSPDALNDTFLSLGYASAASSLNVFGNDCNDVISAETLSMVKEHFIETYGKPDFTIGWGGSGGSMQQHMIAQNYPGLLDAIVPAASYPDILSIVPGIVDCSLLNRAFESSGLAWTDAQKTAVSGYPTWKTCISWMNSYSPAILKPTTCAPNVPKDKGIRCSVFDTQVNLLGRDASGSARRTLDNTGVQYGLAAFQAGKISAEQFVVLNERAGGYDAEGNFTDQRTAADPEVLRIAYSRGRILTGAGDLARIPIIDVRQYRDMTGDIHDSFRSLSTRARLRKTNGSADNHLIWTLPLKSSKPSIGFKHILIAMDGWLTAGGKPHQLTDGCWADNGEIVRGAGCAELYPAFGDPRIVAGAPVANDILKCAVKPVDPASYRHPLSASQLDRLRKVFPQGVCDYEKPGIGQQKLEGTWLKYSNARNAAAGGGVPSTLEGAK